MPAGREYERAFARVVKRRRERLRMSQEALAEAAAVHRTHIGFLERGEKAATVVVARRVALALGLTLAKLTSGVEREFSKVAGGGARKGPPRL